MKFTSLGQEGSDSASLNQLSLWSSGSRDSKVFDARLGSLLKTFLLKNPNTESLTLFKPFSGLASLDDRLSLTKFFSLE